MCHHQCVYWQIQTRPISEMLIKNNGVEEWRERTVGNWCLINIHLSKPSSPSPSSHLLVFAFISHHCICPFRWLCLCIELRNADSLRGSEGRVRAGPGYSPLVCFCSQVRLVDRHTRSDIEIIHTLSFPSMPSCVLQLSGFGFCVCVGVSAVRRFDLIPTGPHCLSLASTRLWRHVKLS